MTFIEFVIIISFVTSVLSILTINRFFHLYELNIKNSFKIDYGLEFKKLETGLTEFVPENIKEMDHFKIY